MGPSSYGSRVSDACYRSVTCTQAELEQTSEEGRPHRLWELRPHVVRTWVDNGKGRPTGGNDWSRVWHTSPGRGTWLKRCRHRAVWRKNLTVWSWTNRWAVHWHSDTWARAQKGSVGKEEVSLQHVGFKESEFFFSFRWRLKSTQSSAGFLIAAGFSLPTQIPGSLAPRWTYLDYFCPQAQVY